VAYMINVPHAFTPEFPADETKSRLCKVPVIVNVYDAYMSGSNQYDFAVDVEPAFPKICETTFCHQSQIVEWLPWVGRHDMPAPKSSEDWAAHLRQRIAKRNRELGIRSDRPMEVFTVTAWGELPQIDQLLQDIPNLLPEFSNLMQLKQRLARWRGNAHE